MTPERWRQVEKLYLASLQREPDKRAVFLAEAASGDEELRREVESLLAQESSGENVLDRPAWIGAANLSGSTTATVLALGAHLGPYRIEAALGAGGMGRVYQARDTRLGRAVAIKILAERFSERFEREARAISALNHPHICTLHDVGPNYLVMELLEGETLAACLHKGPLPMELVLRYGAEISDALAAAHSKGIIHRDLKPGNIMLTKSGVKVFDFGLAKMPVQTGDPLTASHAIVGTLAYMAPEQLEGRACDARTDIFALGLVLHEMATGKRVQAAKGQAAAMDGIPTPFAQIVERCLEPDPENRWHSARDVQAVLDWAGRSQVTAQPSAPKGSARRSWGIAALTCAGLVAIGMAVGWTAYRSGRGHAAPPHVTRFTIEVPDGRSIIPSWNPQVMFSRDARTLLFSAVSNDASNQGALTYRRRFGDLESSLLVKGLGTPVFSPNNEWLMLLDQRVMRIVKYPLSGGAPVPLTAVDGYSRGDWGTDGYYYWTNSARGGIVRISAAGGKIEPVVESSEQSQERTLKNAQLLPGGKALIFTVALGGIESFDDARIDAFNLQSKRRVQLVQGGTFPRYSPSGHIVYARGGSLYAVPFDKGKLEVTGTPQKVLDGVLMSTNTGTAYFDISSAGDLAYAVGTAEGGERTLHWVDRTGKATPVPLAPRSYLHPRISPDARQLVIEVEGANHDFYVHDFERSVTTRMTNDGLSHGPIWSSDGRHLAFRSWKAEMMTMWRLPSDRSGPAERLTNIGRSQKVSSFSPDGNQLLFEQRDDPATGWDIWVLPMRGDRTPKPLVQSKAVEGSAKFSPDGRWVVYCSTESGQAEVYVQPWPGPGPKVQISSHGGTDPIWRRDGKEIFYRSADKMMAAEITMGPPLRAGKPVELWEGFYSHGMSSSCGPPGPTSANYDVSGDGQRFLMVKDNDRDVRATKIVVILNWAEELRLREARTL